MKIAIVTTEYPTEMAPTVGSFVHLNALALAQNHEVTVVHFIPQSQDMGERQYHDGPLFVRSFPNQMNSPEEWEAAWHIVSSISHGFTIIQTMNLRSILAFAHDLSGQLPLSCPWVHFEPWTTKTPPGWPVDAPAVENILLRADALCAVGPSLLEGWEEDRFGMVNEVVPFIVPQPEVLAERDYQPGRVRLVTLGSVSSRHQPELCVRTVNTLVKQGIDATLTWVGDGSMRLRAQDKAAQLGVSERVTFFPTPQVGLAAAKLDEADLFFGPTKEEVFYLPAAQALLAGRPAVLGPGAAHLDYLDPAVTTVVPGGNSKDYAQAILQTLDKTQGVSAAQVAVTVGDRFTPEVIARRFDEVYHLTYDVGGWSA